MSEFLKVFVNGLPLLLGGLKFTMELASISIIIGLFIGLFIAVERVYGGKFAYVLSTAYVEVIRGTPLLVQLFILYFSLPQIGIHLSPLLASMISFSLNSGAYQAEYIRGALQAVEKGQMKAALSLGMSKRQAIRMIVMPQALRKVLPSWTNEFVYLIKYTSLAYLVGVPELTAQGEFYASRNFQFMNVFLSVAVIYLAVIFTVTWLLSILEKKVKVPGV